MQPLFQIDTWQSFVALYGSAFCCGLLLTVIAISFARMSAKAEAKS
ncbi:hypothetical protein PSS2_gp116 [Cyanophage PSS2]|nr:hypothetical protein PSS2_gp116 [Cyanophage PSS2]ACT65678.1 hypothetical protein [Cyanophage PSS2]